MPRKVSQTLRYQKWQRWAHLAVEISIINENCCILSFPRSLSITTASFSWNEIPLLRDKLAELQKCQFCLSSKLHTSFCCVYVPSARSVYLHSLLNKSADWYLSAVGLCWKHMAGTWYHPPHSVSYWAQSFRILGWKYFEHGS